MIQPVGDRRNGPEDATFGAGGHICLLIIIIYQATTARCQLL